MHRGCGKPESPWRHRCKSHRSTCVRFRESRLRGRRNSRAAQHRANAAEQDRRSAAHDDDARLDARIVELFTDTAEGWEFLTVLPDDALAQLRELQRRGKLDKAALIDLWNRYGHLLCDRWQIRYRPNGTRSE